MDFKMPTTYNPPAPAQYSATDYRSTFDANTMFIPQSKYLKEELKNTFGKDFGYAGPSASKPSQIQSSYSMMSIPQPQKYEPKPEIQK